MNRLAKLTAVEGRLFLREPLWLVFTVALPIVLLLILGAVPDFRVAKPELGGARVIDLYVPIIIAMTLTMIGLSALPTALATYREKGILRRLSTTPLPPGTVLTAQVVLNVIMITVLSLVLLGIAAAAFDVPLPANPAGFVLAFVLACATMFTMGMLLAAVAPSAKVASILGSVLFYPLSFFAGLWVPREGMSSTLRTISDFTPLGAGVQAMRDTMIGGWPRWSDLAVMAVFTVLAAIGASRWFRWE